MKTLEDLIKVCKGSVTVCANDHSDCYQDIPDYLKEYMGHSNETIEENIEKDIYDKIIETQNLIIIHFYPNTPIGYFRVYHYDLQLAIEECFKCLT